MNRQHAAAAPAPRRNWVRRLANLLVALVVIAMAAATFIFSYDEWTRLLGGMSARLARYYPGLFDAVLVIAFIAAIVLPRRASGGRARGPGWCSSSYSPIGATDVLHAANYTLRQRTTEGIVAAARWWLCCSRSACFSPCSASQGRTAPTTRPTTRQATGPRSRP